MELNQIIRKFLKYNKEGNTKLIRRAYALFKSTKCDKRHILDVVSVLLSMKADEEMISAALIHDSFIRGRISEKEIQEQLNEKVIKLTKGIHLSISFSPKSNVKDLRSMLLSAIDDLRIIPLKLANELDVMRNIKNFSKEKIRKISKETIEIYAPLAYRFGFHTIKSELEDLAFEQLEPERHNNIKRKLTDSHKEREHRTFQIKKIIENELKFHKIDYVKVLARAKHIYSIYKKIIERSYSLESMMDLVGLRIITKNKKECYNVLKLIHELWIPVPNRFKDYISMPKPNGYQSLHTVVIGVDGKPIEFQIRTKEMHELAEEGIASHFSYKGQSNNIEIDKKLNWLKEIIEISKKSKTLKTEVVDLFSDKIFVYTPKGEVIELPTNSSILDFAYIIHSSLAEKCIGAKVNGKFVSIRHTIENGDTVDLLTSKTQKPSRDWLKFVVTSRASQKIRASLRKQKVIPITTQKRNVEINRYLNSYLVDVESIKNPTIKLALCCKPLPGDKIIGIKKTEFNVIIHKSTCEKIILKNKLKARWNITKNSKIELIIEVKDRPGIIAEILNHISKKGFDIEKLKAKSLSLSVAKINFQLTIIDVDLLNKLIQSIKKLQDVKQVYVKLVK